MKKFIRLPFNNIWLHILAIILIWGLKYIVERFKISDISEKAFLFIFIAVFILSILAFGIIGLIERRGESFKAWAERNEATGKNNFLLTFIHWAQIIPVVMWYIMFVYMIGTDLTGFFLVLLIGIGIRNSINSFNKKETIFSDNHN